MPLRNKNKKVFVKGKKCHLFLNCDKNLTFTANNGDALSMTSLWLPRLLRKKFADVSEVNFVTTEILFFNDLQILNEKN